MNGWQTTLNNVIFLLNIISNYYDLRQQSIFQTLI